MRMVGTLVVPERLATNCRKSPEGSACLERLPETIRDLLPDAAGANSGIISALDAILAAASEVRALADQYIVTLAAIERRLG